MIFSSPPGTRRRSSDATGKGRLADLEYIRLQVDGITNGNHSRISLGVRGAGIESAMGGVAWC